jgi:uncharacterized membrane protein
MLAALTALAGVFVALYLSLFKLGYIGTLVCAVGSCEVVQTSRWASLLGIPVAVWGVAFYVAVLGVALAGLSPALTDSRRLSRLLVAITGTGVLFSAWLTYLELFVINAICQWCVISAILATLLFVICWLDLREVSAVEDVLLDEAADALKGGGYGRGIRNTHEVSIRAVKPDRDEGRGTRE